jgi:hypothetical protein
MNVRLNVVAGFSPRFHNLALAAPRAKARDYIESAGQNVVHL